MEQKPPSEPKVAWEKEEEEGPGAAPAQQPEEMEQSPALLEGTDQTQQRDSALDRFRRTAQSVCRFIKRLREEETSIRKAGARAYSATFKTKTSATLLDLVMKHGVSNPKQVPAMVRYIHRWLNANNESSEHAAYKILLDLTEQYPADVVITLLRVAPSCDRAAMTMWEAIMSSPRTVRPAMLTLLDVLANWPKHSTCTSDGDNRDVFALAATVVMWKVLQLPCGQYVLIAFFPILFVHLLFQAFFSTLEMPDEVETFWKGCQEQHGLATKPNSFAVRTLKALLCRRQCAQVVLAMERRRGWDTLLCADTHHYAVGVLAREMSRVSVPLSSQIVHHMLWLLSREEPHWDLPALAFLVEVLDCLDLTKSGNRVLKIVSRQLQSECRERRRLALRALLEFIDHPSMAGRVWRLTESLTKLLEDTDGDMVAMTLTALGYRVSDKVVPLPSPTALQLAEALLPLFDNDNSLVQRLSMFVFRGLVTSVGEKGKKALKTKARQSLLPLYFHCHDEKTSVAQASQEVLLAVAKFLKRWDLKQLVQKNQLWKFGECLLAKDRSRAAEHLRHALPYLDSPEESLREEAVRFLGILGRHLRGQQEEFHVICKALDDMADDVSPAIANLALQTFYILQAVQRTRLSRAQRLQEQLQKAWKTRPRLRGFGWLRCWSSVES